MKSERLAYAFGKINDDLIYGAVNDTKKKYSWRRWIAAAACVCFVVGAAVAIRPSGGKETVQEQLLAAIKTGGTMDAAAVETTIPVDSRIAVYEQIYAGSSTGIGIDGPESPDSTENLQPFVGEIYTVWRNYLVSRQGYG